MDLATPNRASEHPIHAAVAMIRAAIAVFAKCAAELANDHHYRISPRRPHLVGICRDAAAKFFETPGEITSRTAFADVRVPSAHIDETEIELLPHQPGDTARFQLESP